MTRRSIRSSHDTDGLPAKRAAHRGQSSHEAAVLSYPRRGDASLGSAKLGVARGRRPAAGGRSSSPLAAQSERPGDCRRNTAERQKRVSPAVRSATLLLPRKGAVKRYGCVSITALANQW